MENQQSPWFEGSVGDAVAKTKAENLLFLAFIYDDDENSKKMRELLSDNDISFLMKTKSVAIEMKKGSETFILFSQIYPTFFCPCLVFIQNGRLVYFLNVEANKEKIIENINKYSDMEQVNQNIGVPTQNQNVNTNTNINTNTNTSNINNNITSPKSSSQAEKIQKEKELNNEKKKERIEELKKLKQDNDARRKQILEQINNDRKERESRNSSNSRGSSSENLQKLLNEKSKITSNSNNALMSIRYLDGSLLRQEFKRNQKLSDIRKWIDDTTKAKGIYKPYNLETRYPEHQFTYGEETKTLLDLNLDDTDLLICKPVSKVFSSNPKQTLDIGKYFTSNFLKDLMLFFYAFILSLNIFKDPMKSKEEGGEENDSSQNQNQNFTYKKGKIRMNSGEKKMGTINDIRNDNKKPQETYNGNSTNQQ
ncbi:hypothetical protein BCR32DRAFT_265461 [Anaeromyces robustus]|uniref:UBX domain-containing protein n=1 Tax=Anaeromyces robustus TaxID=1754192 RepID=A0A1Y1XJ46_9FUNG|nr:hypothetical protein BCR32DRAFT_265461 [Anaeromyces robustus]|eukprot:ORX85712.1 hypothetical protein BCR32DRAFT_265461 [Anaeromyces robustus]